MSSLLLSKQISMCLKIIVSLLALGLKIGKTAVDGISTMNGIPLTFKQINAIREKAFESLLRLSSSINQ